MAGSSVSFCRPTGDCGDGEREDCGKGRCALLQFDMVGGDGEAGPAGLWAVRTVNKGGLGVSDAIFWQALIFLDLSWIVLYPTKLRSLVVVLSKGRSEVRDRGLDRRVVETKLKLLRRGARTTMGHVEVAMQRSHS